MSVKKHTFRKKLATKVAYNAFFAKREYVSAAFCHALKTQSKSDACGKLLSKFAPCTTEARSHRITKDLTNEKSPSEDGLLNSA